MFKFCLFSVFSIQKAKPQIILSNYRRQFPVYNFPSSSCQHEIQTLIYPQYIPEYLYYIVKLNICLIPAKLFQFLAKHEVHSYHVFLLYTFSCRENYVLLNKDFGKCSSQSFSLERIIRISYSSD